MSGSTVSIWKTDGVSASDRLADLLEPIGQSVLGPGEELLGVCAASEIGIFSGHTRAVVVTRDRIVIQPVDRYWRAKGEPQVIEPADVETVGVSGLGDDWYGTAISLVNHAGYTVKLRLTDGKKLKLMAMSGEGKLLGAVGGGEFQANGSTALLRWLGGLGQAR